jgi:hypothetical protein
MSLEHPVRHISWMSEAAGTVENRAGDFIRATVGAGQTGGDRR